MKKMSLFQKIKSAAGILFMILSYIGVYKINMIITTSCIIMFILCLNSLLYSFISEEIAELKDKLGKKEN